ncbi:hypothetical protein LWM68_17745 [Niabella sp. W65]|nr:hypothetical protein [Niabella sp. W65]MCH7364431.1 hypothetical protein [Niabella sp. W65]
MLVIAQLSEFDVMAQKKENVDMAKLVKDNFAFADSQYRYMMKQVPQDKMPQSYDEKNKNL